MNKDLIRAQILFLEASANTCSEYVKIADKIKQLRVLLGENNEESDKEDFLKKISKKTQDFALLYLFELNLKGFQPPIRMKEGGFDKKAIALIGENDYLCKGDSFYSAVKRILNKYDLNKINHLERINKNWLQFIKDNCNNWSEMSKYLKEKGLCQG